MSAANDRTDKCGNPNPDVCIPQTIRVPICYLTPALISAGATIGLPGFQVIQVNADCTGDPTVIENADGVTVVGATQAPCPCVPSAFGVGGF